jgi:hypothetical protein
VGVVRLLNAELNSFPAVSRKDVVRKSFGELNAARARGREHVRVNMEGEQLKKSIKKPTIAMGGVLEGDIVVVFIRDRFHRMRSAPNSGVAKLENRPANERPR